MSSENTPKMWSTPYCKVQGGGQNHYHMDEEKERIRSLPYEEKEMSTKMLQSIVSSSH